MGYRHKQTIYESDKYMVVSYGHGAAYAIVRKSDNASVWLQDEASIPFHNAAQRVGWDMAIADYDHLMQVNKNT